MLQVNEKKLQRQLVAVDKWRKAGGIGGYDFVTGFGKTHTTCIIINRMFDRNPVAHIIIVVPNIQLVSQWKERLESNIEQKDLIKNIEIFTIHILVERQLKFDCTLLILDEIHEYYSEERLRFLDKTMIQYKYILGLSATWRDKDNRHLYLELICPIIDTIDEEEALREGYISEFIEFNVPVNLTDEEKLRYDKYTKVILENINKFGKGGLELASLCLSGDKKKHTAKDYCFMWASKHGWVRGMDMTIQTNKEINDLWNPAKIIGYANQLMMSIRDRKDILYSAENKLLIALEIIEKYPDLKTVCFSQSTQFASTLGHKINEFFYNKEGNNNRCVTYHSKLETQMGINPKTGKPMKYGMKRLKDIAIKRISDGTATHLSTASALDKGLDIKDLRLGISTSSTQNPTQGTQRSGRLKRNEFTENEEHSKIEKTKLIVNVYVKNSKDEDWLRKRQSTATSSRIYWVNNVEQINYNPIRDDEFNINEI